MAKIKNALTKYYVGPSSGSGGPDTLNRLAKWITEVTDDSEENVEEVGYYDGDGNPEEEVISIKKTYSFQGSYDELDPAMKFIAGLEMKVGEERTIMFRQVRTSGDVYEGPATLKDVKVTGGEATSFADFSCAISWQGTPSKGEPEG